MNRLQSISPPSLQGAVRLFPQILVPFSKWRKLGSDTAWTLNGSKKISALHFTGKEWQGHLYWQQWLTMSLRFFFHNRVNLPLTYYLPWKLIKGQLHSNSVIDGGWQSSNFFPPFFMRNWVGSFVRFKIPLKPVSVPSPLCLCTYGKGRPFLPAPNMRYWVIIGKRLEFVSISLTTNIIN